MNSVFFVAQGQCWTGPGRSFWNQILCFDAQDLAERTASWQAHPVFVKEIPAPQWAMELVAQATSWSDRDWLRRQLTVALKPF